MQRNGADSSFRAGLISHGRTAPCAHEIAGERTRKLPTEAEWPFVVADRGGQARNRAARGEGAGVVDASGRMWCVCCGSSGSGAFCMFIAGTHNELGSSTAPESG
jgi:hypothetical protein